MEQTECSKTSAYKIQTPGNYPEESIQHSEHGESLKSRMLGGYSYMQHAIIFIVLVFNLIAQISNIFSPQKLFK
jgi:hypothetical protein